MADPEILDPEQNASGGAADDLVAVVGRAFPGALVREQGFRIEVEGAHGTLRIIRTPFATLAVFRGMRIPLPPNPQDALPMLSSLGHGERVLVEERGTATLRRTHLVRVVDGALETLDDTTVDREAVPHGVMRVVSFTAPPRDATPAERAFMHRAIGGTLGRLKRKLMEKVLEKTVGTLVDAVKGASERGAVLPGDDGARTLPPPAK